MKIPTITCAILVLIYTNAYASFCHIRNEASCPEKLKQIIYVKRGDTEYCMSLIDAAPKHVDYNLPAKIKSIEGASLAFQNLRTFERPGKYATFVDVNNDGIKELIVPTELSSMTTRYKCESTSIAIINEATNTILKSELSSLLEAQCSQYAELVEIDGKIYYELRQEIDTGKSKGSRDQQFVTGFYYFSDLEAHALCEYRIDFDDERRIKYKKTLPKRSTDYGQCINEPVSYSKQKRIDYCTLVYGRDAKEEWEKM